MHRRRFLYASAALGAAALALPDPLSTLADQELSIGTQAIVTSDGLHVRGGPGAAQPLVGSLDSGATVDLLGVSPDGAWWRVATTDVVGYVSQMYLQPTGQPVAGGVFDLDLPLTYARQLSPIWCDPADLEMWLDYRAGGATSGPSANLQSRIWDWETTHNAGFSVDQWDCSPYAVASAARQWLPGAGFDHFLYDDPLSGSRVLAWLLANPGFHEPSIALVWRGLHYILVRGVRATADPGRDQSAQLLGFYVADPDSGASFWLGQDRFIPIDRWLNDLFTPVSYLTPHTGVPDDIWQNRLVTIQRSWTDGPTDSGQRNAVPTSYAT